MNPAMSPRMAPAVSCIGLSIMFSSLIFATAPPPAKQAASRKPAQAGARKPMAASDEALDRRARVLHKEAIVIDTHNDITSPMVDEGFDLGSAGDDPQAKTKTHHDLRRRKAGGLAAEFFAVYVGREFVNKKPAEGGGAARRTLDVIDAVYSQVE